MLKLRYFFLSLNVLNGLLAAAVAAVVFLAVLPFLNPTVMSLPQAKETAAAQGEKMAPPPGSPPADYAVISEKNLFHPERKTPPEKQQEKVIPKPDLSLYGTLITDDASFAFVEDKKAPYSTAGRGKRQLSLKKGESLGGYILSEIEANRIVLVKGDDRLVVTLDDRGKKRGGEAPAPPAAARSTSGGVLPFPQAPAAPSFPRTASPSAQPATSPRQGIGGIPGSGQSPQPFASPSPQAAPPGQGATSGASGLTPPGRRTGLSEIQKLKAARPMSSE